MPDMNRATDTDITQQVTITEDPGTTTRGKPDKLIECGTYGENLRAVVITMHLTLDHTKTKLMFPASDGAI